MKKIKIKGDLPRDTCDIIIMQRWFFCRHAEARDALNGNRCIS